MKRTRHSITTLALWLGAGLLLAGAHAEGNTLAGSRPNIVFILTDDQGHGQMGCQGMGLAASASRCCGRGVSIDLINRGNVGLLFITPVKQQSVP